MAVSGSPVRKKRRLVVGIAVILSVIIASILVYAFVYSSRVWVTDVQKSFSCDDVSLIPFFPDYVRRMHIDFGLWNGGLQDGFATYQVFLNFQPWTKNEVLVPGNSGLRISFSTTVSSNCTDQTDVNVIVKVVAVRAL